MRVNSDDFVAVATIGRPFGLNGACSLFVIGETLLDSSFPMKLWVGNEEAVKEITLLEISGGNNLRCVFEGVNDRDEADLLKNSTLYLEKERLPELEDGEYYFRDLLGLSIESETGEVLGTVKDVFNYPTTDAFDVKLLNGKTITIPFNKEIVKKVIVGEKKIVVDNDKISELTF
jgi:16S rRNA processing protein RimM